MVQNMGHVPILIVKMEKFSFPLGDNNWIHWWYYVGERFTRVYAVNGMVKIADPAVLE